MSDPRRYIPAVILITGCLSLLKTSRQEARPLDGPLSAILPSVPGFVARNQVVSKEEQAVAGMTEYMARVYARDSVIAFSALVSYYDRQTQGKSIHSPKNCMPGAGWEILTTGTASVGVDGRTHTVNRNILKNGPATAVVLYWYQGRGRVVASEYAVKWNLLRDAALLGHTEEALVRIVVPVVPQPGSPDQKAAIARADSLAIELASRLVSEVEHALPKAASARPRSEG
jgi:EpsI family protein